MTLLPEPTVYNHDAGRWDTRDPEWEMRTWPRALWLDCGQQSGATIFWFDPRALYNPKLASSSAILAWWSSYLVGPENYQAQEVERLIQSLMPPATAVPVGGCGMLVGCEYFTVQKVEKQPSFLSSPRIASKVDYACFGGLECEGIVHRPRVIYQNPIDIDKTPKGDERLRQLQLFKPGADHRNDATKHSLLHLRRLKGMGMTSFREMYGWDDFWMED